MKKIAVVEDNPDNRLLVRVILETLYDVTEYESGISALENLHRQRPDLVLLDISLPEMDGTEVLQRIRADDRLKNLPVIALTAHAMSGDREKYISAGFNDYITKPILDENILLGAIKKLLDGTPVDSVPAPKTTESWEAGLERLKKMGGGKFAAEMIGLFLDYTQTKIDEARRAFAAGDGGAVARAVHPIKSSAGNVGATVIQDLAGEIEQLGKQQQTGPLEQRLAALEKIFIEMKPKLEARRKDFENEPA